MGNKPLKSIKFPGLPDTYTIPQGGEGGSITVDDALSSSSTNPVQNKVVKAALDLKANSSSLGNKLDKAQGAANAGKFLVVGSNGNIELVTMTEWQGGSY